MAHVSLVSQVPLPSARFPCTDYQCLVCARLVYEEHDEAATAPRSADRAVDVLAAPVPALDEAKPGFPSENLLDLIGGNRVPSGKLLDDGFEPCDPFEPHLDPAPRLVRPCCYHTSRAFSSGARREVLASSARGAASRVRHRHRTSRRLPHVPDVPPHEDLHRQAKDIRMLGEAEPARDRGAGTGRVDLARGEAPLERGQAPPQTADAAPAHACAAVGVMDVTQEVARLAHGRDDDAAVVELELRREQGLPRV
jgi:hypothetical protein